MINFWDGEDDIAQWLPTMCPDSGAQGSISGINYFGGNFEVLQLYWLDESEQQLFHLFLSFLGTVQFSTI